MVRIRQSAPLLGQKMKKTTPSPHKPIKLHAQHHDHIPLIASHVQDAVIPASAFIHDSNTKTFKMLGNRFCWEKFLDPENPIKVRVQSGIHFDHVVNVKKKNVHLHHPEKLYNLMTMNASENEVILHLSEHAEIRLDVEKISCKIADLHEPYPAEFLPTHSTVEHD